LTGPGGPPLVSIVVICHNYGRFLADAVESALAQTHSPCEVVVVDDGSTDDSLAVAERYRDRVHVVSRPHQGVEEAVNSGVAEANGAYVARLDADDVFEPTYVEDILAALDDSPEAAFAYCRATQFGARQGTTRSFPFSVYLLLRRGNYVNASALIRRDAFLAVGGYAALGEHANEDWDLWLRLAAAGRRGTYVRTPLLRWRRHAGGSRNPEGDRLDRSWAALRDRHEALEQSVSDWRGRLAYALDLTAAGLDQLVGFSRSRRLVRRLERASWRRFQRWHAPQLTAGD
jgi:glycosyltransferase involved in cell wall biosynthesis